jgi:hypothetical protein
MSQFGYTIRRITAPGEPVDPCAPLEFFPPKGSDELHEALKAAFPFEPTLQARMRQAVINFHLSEAQADFAESEFVQDEYLPSPQSSFMSNVTSPSMSAPISRQTTSTSRGPSDPPAQEELMDVWSLPSKPAAKIHTRRNMTPEEKKAYKAKRLAGACGDCKRRRRKCDHDSSSPTQASSKKVKARKRSVATQSPANQSCAAPAASFAIAPVSAVQDNFSFAPQDNFFSFDAGFDSSMDFGMSAGMGFDDGFNNDVGFDLNTDFALFPDSTTQTNLPSGELDAASWLAGSPVSLDIDKQHAATAQDFNNWPMAAYGNAGVPLTPQSLSPQSLLMSRSQSGQSPSSSSLGSMFASHGGVDSQAVLSQDFNQPAFSHTFTGVAQLSQQSVSPQSLLMTPLSRTSSGHSLHSSLSSDGVLSSHHTSAGPALLSPQSVPMSQLVSPTTSIQSGGSRSSSSSSQHWPAASRVAPGSTSHVFTDHGLDLTVLERNDQRLVSTTGSADGLTSPSAALQSESSTTTNRSPSTSSSSDQDEHARLKSSEQGSALPPDRGASAPNASRRRSTRTSSRTISFTNSPTAGVQFVRPSDLIGQASHIENSSGHIDMSKLCRLKHASANADGVCSALLSNAGLPPFGRSSPSSPSTVMIGRDGSKSFVDNAANAFQWIILLLFAAMHLFGFSSTSLFDNNVKPSTSRKLVIEIDDQKEAESTSPIKSHQKPHQKPHLTTSRRYRPWQSFTGFIQQSVCRLGSRMEKIQSASSRLC